MSACFNPPLKELGNEYPEAVTFGGIRMTLVRERDFSRVYRTEDRKGSLAISRFWDGSASISLSEVEAGWPVWSDTKRLDFSGACDAVGGQSDFPDILRFVMRNADVICISAVASSVAHSIPRDEAFELLSAALRNTEGSGTANIASALARTKHPEAKSLLLAHLKRLWDEGDLWDDDPFKNWRAFDVTCCIARLLELGAPPGEFEEKVRRLAAHRCHGNRESCSAYLRRHYDWLPPREVRPSGA